MKRKSVPSWNTKYENDVGHRSFQVCAFSYNIIVDRLISSTWNVEYEYSLVEYKIR